MEWLLGITTKNWITTSTSMTYHIREKIVSWTESSHESVLNNRIVNKMWKIVTTTSRLHLSMSWKGRFSIVQGLERQIPAFKWWLEYKIRRASFQDDNNQLKRSIKKLLSTWLLPQMDWIRYFLCYWLHISSFIHRAGVLKRHFKSDDENEV